MRLGGVCSSAARPRRSNSRNPPRFLRRLSSATQHSKGPNFTVAAALNTGPYAGLLEDAFFPTPPSQRGTYPRKRQFMSTTVDMLSSTDYSR